ncbi:MAG TPA: xanthine phosphoribosyltransferase [Candidatus Acetothermia bacterium]|nr:xanthine phosphoribosyltransferase [Candidatus Bipolaricaulota bacterium]RLE39153.1 MAG: xanthine phosphoribosyltransferase [Candidatus Acetothermia bacterium]HDJ29617.1 xanthine phosphoribosyltransferase [Candidatus Acetothermia bacterium]
MQLQDWVQRYGVVVGPEFLRVDGFLNHRIDPKFMEEVGRQLADRFAAADVSCVLTAEAAGNIVAYEVARRIGARALYAKKGRAATMNRPFVRSITSPTKGTTVELSVSKDYLNEQERVLIVDDFLYRGDTSSALADMVRESGATLVGFGFVIAKEFGEGRRVLTRYGVPIVTLVSIIRMDPETGKIEFAAG